MSGNNNAGKGREYIELFLIRRDLTVKDAMKRMDEVGEKTLLVVDEDRRLLGSLTDGDIRRWILSEGSLEDNIERTFNKSPIYVEENYEIDEVKRVMVGKKIARIPVVDKVSKILDILLWEDIFGGKKIKEAKVLDIPVVIMGGGQGNRLDPFTRILPKPLIPIGEKAAIELIMDHFVEYGYNNFFLVINYKAGMIRSYFDNIPNRYRINFIQEDTPRGTVGGLKSLPDGLPQNFFVTNCDIIIKADYEEIYTFHIDNNNDITIVGSMQHFKIPYGVMKISNGGDLDGMVEKPEHDFLVNTGMYVFKREILSLIPDRDFFHATDLIGKIKSRRGKIGVYPISERSWMDIGQWEEYRKTVEKLRLFK